MSDIDDQIDVAREQIFEERERVASWAAFCAEYALPPTRLTVGEPVCERCLQPSGAALCPVCDPWGEGLYEENRWTFDE